MSDFEVRIEGNFLKQIPKMKKDIEKVAARVLKKTALQTEKEISSMVDSYKLINMDLKKLKKTKTITRQSDIKGGIDGMNIAINISDRPQNAYRFWPSYTSSAGRKSPWIGTIAGKRVEFAKGQAFFVKRFKTMYVRASSAKYPFIKFKGPSLADMMADGGHVTKLVKLSEVNLRVNLLKGLGKDLDI